MARDSFIDIEVDAKEFAEALKAAERMHEAITPQWLKSTQRRHLQPMVQDMKHRCKSTRIEKLIGVTTARRRAGELGAKVGVVKDDKRKDYKLSGPAHAALLEYGSAGERFRKLRVGPLITGRVSTGVMPATPFLRPAWDTHVRTFMDNVEKAIVQKVMKEA